MIVNARQNELLKPGGAVHLEWEGDDLIGCTMQPQSMSIWQGLELIGCTRGSGKKRVVQGVVYVITDIAESDVQLEMLDEYCRDPLNKCGDEIPKVPIEEMCSQLRLTHAMCYYTIQGRTIKNRHIQLLDTDHPHFGVRSLIVGLSRATHGRFLHVGDSTSEGLFVGVRRVLQCK
jgi:hypothetical protein